MSKRQAAHRFFVLDPNQKEIHVKEFSDEKLAIRFLKYIEEKMIPHIHYRYVSNLPFEEKGWVDVFQEESPFTSEEEDLMYNKCKEAIANGAAFNLNNIRSIAE